MEHIREIKNQLTEEWRPVIGYYGYYEVSNLGEVRTVERSVRHPKGGLLKLKSKIKKPVLSTTRKYAQITLNKEGKMKAVKVHRLVAQCFIENPLNHPQVNHKDGNKLNNSVDNLEWCSAKHNIIHAYKNGLMSAVHGELHVYSKLTDQDVLNIREAIKNGVMQKSLAVKYNVCVQTINDIHLLKTWKHLIKS